MNRVCYLYEELEKSALAAADLYEERRSKITSDMVGVQNLVCSTPDQSKVLFDNMTFEVKHREPMIVMGPSGSGKTSLLRVLG